MLRTVVGHIQGTNRREELLFPERLDDSSAEDHPVRFSEAFVDERDLAQLGFPRVKAAATGRPAYYPGDRLQLSMYGYLYRLRASRRLEQETHRQVELMWRLPKLRPDPKTIANFRRANLQPLRRVCRAGTLLCKQLALCSGEWVALDGSQCKAVNAQERHLPPSKLQWLLPHIEERIAA